MNENSFENRNDGHIVCLLGAAEKIKDNLKIIPKNITIRLIF